MHSGRMVTDYRRTFSSGPPASTFFDVKNHEDKHDDLGPRGDPSLPALIPAHQASPYENRLVPTEKGELILQQPAVVVTREIEWLQIFVGFEQANRYKIQNGFDGEVLGFIMEETQSIGKAFLRQLARRHRSFSATILDPDGQIVFRIRRPFYLVASTMNVEDESGSILGEIHMKWHPWRRKYDLFRKDGQFAQVDAPLLAWEFTLQDLDGKTLAKVDKNWTGLARVLFTDGSQYVVHFEHTQDAIRSLHIDERAIVLACAIAIDFDYFSLHSGGFVGGMPLPLPTMMGGGGDSGDLGVSDAGEGGGGIESTPFGSAASASPPPSPPPPPSSGGWSEEELRDPYAGETTWEDEPAFDADDGSGGESSSWWDTLGDILSGGDE